MRNLLKIVILFSALLIAVVPMTSAQRLNEGGRCIHEAGIYQHDQAGVQGIGIEVYFVDTGTVAYELPILFTDIAAVLTDEDEDGLLEAPDGLLFEFGDIRYFHSNNGTPEDLTDDFVTIAVLTAANPDTVACLFVFEFRNFDTLSRGDLTVAEQYPDGRIFITTGN